MNPFVNPKKRGVSLPSGCKDLIDVLRRRESGHDSAVLRFNPNQRSIALPVGCTDLADTLDESKRLRAFWVRRCILGMLWEAQECQASEVSIAAVPINGEHWMRYKADGSWHDLVPFRADIWPDLFTELVRMGGLSEASFPIEGILDTSFDGVRLSWKITMESENAECMLSRNEGTSQNTA